ncbi:GNAT family N-acetyltransferase [Pseudomonas syringae]|nr:GNAT family N-acetyltransferase [Pseudomonas syringae]
MKHVNIQLIAALPSQVMTLEKEATTEGFRFLTRLIEEWRTGTNRFDAQGECLMAAYLGDRLVGIGGLTRDPFTQENIGRLRRVYIAREARGQNIGRALVNSLVEHATQHFRIMRLSTDTSDAAAFYVRCGFQTLDDEHATHAMFLGAA